MNGYYLHQETPQPGKDTLSGSGGEVGVLSWKRLPPSYSHCLSMHPFIHSVSQALPKCLLVGEHDGEVPLTAPLIMAGLSCYPGLFLQHVILPLCSYLFSPWNVGSTSAGLVLFVVLSPLPRRTPDTKETLHKDLLNEITFRHVWKENKLITQQVDQQLGKN